LSTSHCEMLRASVREGLDKSDNDIREREQTIHKLKQVIRQLQLDMSVTKVGYMTLWMHVYVCMFV